MKNLITNWFTQRAQERTTWDGVVICLVCLLVILASPLIKWVAWAGVAYGIWTIVQSERNRRNA